MEVFFEKEIEKVKHVKNNKKYWFIRTYAGEAFNFYIDEAYVGLGLNNVPLKFIQSANINDSPSYSTLQNYIDKNTDYKKGEATKWANQLISFTNEMSIGDTVIIPSKSSDKLAFGTITSDVYLTDKPGRIVHRGKDEFLPEKRRTVTWNEMIRKEDLQGELRGMLSSHQGITNVDEFAYIIEGAQESIFIKDEQMYLVLQVGKNEAINAFDLQAFLSGLTYFYHEFCNDNGFTENQDLTIKIRLQSRGKAYLAAGIFVGMVGLAGMVMLCNNPQVKFKMKSIEFEAGAKDGGLKTYSDFLDRKQQREMELIKFNDSIKRLNAKQNENENILVLEKKPANDSQKRGEKPQRHRDSN